VSFARDDCLWHTPPARLPRTHETSPVRALGSTAVKTAVRFSLERIAALDRAVRAGEYPNSVSLGLALEVSRRTVQRDIEFLRERLGAPLAFDPRRNGYYYDKPDFRLPPVNLTEGELVALFLAERVLQQYRGTPYAADLARAFRKISIGLSDRVTVDLGHLGEAHSFRTTAASGLEPGLFGDLEAAIRGRRRVAMAYYSASSDRETAREVDPYHLASVDGQWYLIGHCHLRGEVRMFAPARIRSLSPTGAIFDPPAGFRVDDYLAQSFAVLRGEDGESHRVRLRFTGEAVRYVRERTWHPSQTSELTPEGDLVVTLEVSHLREVERLALSWGAECIVIDPEELRERVARTLAKAADQYRRIAGNPGAPKVGAGQQRGRRSRPSSSR
jgi:predicted DNA-binding transcriptional regulator YafY